MTQPQSKIYHRTAMRGEFVQQIGKTKSQSLGLQRDSQINEQALQVAIDTVDELFDFWRLIQSTECNLEMITGHWNVFKAMRRWPRG